MDNEVKRELLLANAGEPVKQEFIEIVSQPAYEVLPRMAERRFIKTHLPFSLLPPSIMANGAKVEKPEYDRHL